MRKIADPQAPSWGSRLVGMEGLRGLAATTVLIQHVSVNLAGSVDKGAADPPIALMDQGLTLFFTLSGFLLYRSFAAAIVTGRRFPVIGGYFRNRAVRIFPVYIVILLVASLVVGSAFRRAILPGDGPEGVPDTVGYLTDPVKLLSNLFMVQTLFPSTMRTGLGVSWSLTVELIFYLVLPVLAWVAFRLRRSRRGAALLALAPAVVLLLLGLLGKAVLAKVSNPTSFADWFYLEWGGSWTAVLARSFFVHADLFAFGMLAAVIAALFAADVLPPHLVTPARWTALLTGAVAAWLAHGTVLQNTGFAVLFGAVVLFVALPAGAPGVAARVLDWLPFRFVGEVSYSVYLWHMPVIWTLARHHWAFPATLPGFYANVVLVFVVTLLLSSATYLLIEKPAQQRFRRRTDQQTAQGGSVPATAVGREVSRK
ncbi:hypothetical protein ASG12_18950 [Williamsia sp. Leaf354]|jgi:peptidoglycan/LPS O-acetylase OafA/YrhL|uniref:acyltransferase family protein n=1 Tax=Williamsia sp. Leaf354 TaxID=1736349 RepID=UPI0006F700F0|nr:acyltransferase [Williamsia sp. Leaf354]KQR96269.1 hypothetical protein ASG12_18950 [Williamsia sp. Leaf354]